MDWLRTVKLRKVRACRGQITSDVSLELRSPLARLNVALDLCRERKGNDPAFKEMDEDIRLQLRDKLSIDYRSRDI